MSALVSLDPSPVWISELRKKLRNSPLHASVGKQQRAVEKHNQVIIYFPKYKSRPNIPEDTIAAAAAAAAAIPYIVYNRNDSLYLLRLVRTVYSKCKAGSQK